MALPAAAQSWDEARMFSENIYGGTARSIAMGNALTAVGGDPGSVGINPAGSSVAGYSQFFITPALSISATTSQGFGEEGMDPVGMGDRVMSGYTRMKLPNMGFILKMDTGHRHGLKRVSFGFMSNSTNDFTFRMNSAGTYYGKDSYSGSLASLAQGYTTGQLVARTTDDWFIDGPAWEAMAGFMSGIFDREEISGKYLGITDMMVGGKAEAVKPLYQKYGYQTRGYKHDIILNVSANFEDKFYIGANFGITTMSYYRQEYWEEMPDDPSTFPKIIYDGGAKQATFNSLTAKRNYGVSGAGIYFKVGMLWRPFAGLRIGAAVQTPTLMDMTGRNAVYAETNLSGIYFAPSQSPEDQWKYSLSLPFRWNAGLAYSFGSFAVLSVDYEMADYSHSRYNGRSEGGYSNGIWKNENADICDALGIGHNVRAGFEFKPIEALAIRVGYNYLTGSQKNWLVWNYTGDEAQLTIEPLTKEERAAQVTHAASFGVGYAWGGFFADLAVRLRFQPTYYYIPYVHYTYATDYQNKHVDTQAEVPSVTVASKGIDTVLTLGWRF